MGTRRLAKKRKCENGDGSDCKRRLAKRSEESNKLGRRRFAKKVSRKSRKRNDDDDEKPKRKNSSPIVTEPETTRRLAKKRKCENGDGSDCKRRLAKRSEESNKR